jgi:hypothetical protein
MCDNAREYIQDSDDQALAKKVPERLKELLKLAERAHV